MRLKEKVLRAVVSTFYFKTFWKQVDIQFSSQPQKRSVLRSKDEALRLQQNSEHAAKRFGSAPQQLIPDGEGAKIFIAHIQFS